MREKWDDFWELFQGMRKFLILLIVFTIGIIFRAKDLINGAQIVELIKDITLGYLASNSAEHVTNAVQTHYANKAVPVKEESQEQALKQEAESLEAENG